MKVILKGNKKQIIEDVTRLMELSFKDNEILTATVSNVRSLPQNSLLHALLQEIGNEIGELEIDVVKETMKLHLGYFDYVNFDGKIVIIPAKSSLMSTEQINEFIEKLTIFMQNFLNMKTENIN